MVFSSASSIAVEQELSRLRQLAPEQIPSEPDSAIVLAIGEDNTILWANDRAHEHFRQKPCGEKCYSLCHGRNSSCGNCIVKAVINDGFTRRHKKHILSGNGEHACFLIAISKLAADYCKKMKSAMAVLFEVPHESHLFNSKILVVDDNRINLKLVEKTLSSLGCEVVTAENGPEALKNFEVDSYDAVFMDIQMPEMDGYQTTRKIREMKGRGGDNIPVIALSAYQETNCVKRCYDAGMNDFIGKPFRKEDLIESLRKHIKPWGGN